MEPTKKIRHLVLSGGGGIIFAYYGAMRESNKAGFWNINDIQTIHGVSCGAILAAMLAMTKYIHWDDYDDFIIKRPWETVIDFSPKKLFNAYANTGICGKEAIQDVFSPLLNALDLPMDVTLQQFVEFVGIDVHFYATDFNTYELVDLCAKTHPEWTLLDAVYSSCALPFLFQPNIVDGVCYIDGGMLCNYPVNQCLHLVEDADEIFGMNKTVSVESEPTVASTNYTNLMEYVFDIVAKTARKIRNQTVQIKHTLEFLDELTTAWEVYNALKDRESRTAKVQKGVDIWTNYAATLDVAPSGLP